MLYASFLRSVYSVGCGLGGKLGHGTRTDEKYPRLIEQFQQLNLQPMVVAAGAWHAAVVGRDGRVCTWGWGRYGCLGHGNEDCESVPKVVESLGDVKAVHVATGDYTTFVVTNTGDVYSFGCGESASLGHNPAGDGQVIRNANSASQVQVCHTPSNNHVSVHPARVINVVYPLERQSQKIRWFDLDKLLGFLWSLQMQRLNHTLCLSLSLSVCRATTGTRMC